MNYISEINAFHTWLEVHPLSSGQISLWYALMQYDNRSGWSEWFAVPSMLLQLHTGLSRQGMIKARSVLVEAGLVQFRSGDGKAGKYKMESVCDVLSRIQTGIPLYKQKQKQEQKTLLLGSHQNVRLTQAEYDALCSQYPNTQQAIEYLSDYIRCKGYQAQNHDHALRSWVFDALREREIKRLELDRRERSAKGKKTRYTPKRKMDIEGSLADSWALIEAALKEDD